MTILRTATDWLAPLRPILHGLTADDWNETGRLCGVLSDLAPSLPRDDTAARSTELLRIRKELARQRYTAGEASTIDHDDGRTAARRVLCQFVCGFYDADLRDAIGPGHGALASHLRSADLRHQWRTRLETGELVGIAMSERHGGSRSYEPTTVARWSGRGTWLLHGDKSYVSRLLEAAGFVVFFRDPYGGVSATLLDARRAGLSRDPDAPAGLGGWSWGYLRLRDVEIEPETELLGHPGDGHGLREWHFTRYRPLVAATAAGTAAGVHSKVVATLVARHRIGVVERVRDHGLGALARSHYRIRTALLDAIATARLAERGDSAAALWARIGKASAVEAACTAVDELWPLLGAQAFRAASSLMKARNDLAAYRLADGANDELYRSGGRIMLGP